MIVLTVLFTVSMPYNCNDVLQQLMLLTNMDILPLPDYMMQKFNFSETESFSQKFEDAGYEG